MQIRLWLVIGFGLVLNLCPIKNCCSQVCFNDDDCEAEIAQQQSKQKNKEAALKVLNKALVYISYLNYSDRTSERVFTGPHEFEPHQGKIIRSIEMRILEPFGVSLEHPFTQHYTRFQKFANSIQFKTREWAVKNELLFKTGEPVDPIQFADSEKNLWQRGTFKDLKIYVVPIAGNDSLVDVFIELQDRWSWSISTSAQYNKAVIGFEFNNLMGMPQSVSQKISINYRRDNPFTVYGGYEYDNILHSHIDLGTEYQYENLNKGGAIHLSRDFFSVNARWAAQVNAGIYREQAAVPNELARAIPTNIFYNYQDVWGATSFNLSKSNDNLNRFIVASRVYRMSYMGRPYNISPDSSQMFFNHFFALGAIGYANWNYYVDHSVFFLGKAEYFPKGFNVSLVGGYDYDEELGKRFYSGIQSNYGGYVDKLGYINTKISYSGFLNKLAYNQLLAKWTNRFFSAPVNLGKKFFIRQFFTSQVFLGFNRPADRLIAMNNYNGVRGVFVNYIRGSRTYTFKFETDIYPKFKVLGFSSCLFVLADIAIVQQNSYSGGQLCQGYGAGLRLRNLSLGIGFFEFAFVYYPSFSIPGYKSYATLATTDYPKGISRDNLFDAGVLSPEF